MVATELDFFILVSLSSTRVNEITKLYQLHVQWIGFDIFSYPNNQKADDKNDMKTKTEDSYWMEDEHLDVSILKTSFEKRAYVM